MLVIVEFSRNPTNHIYIISQQIEICKYFFKNLQKIMTAVNKNRSHWEFIYHPVNNFRLIQPFFRGACTTQCIRGYAFA